MSFVVVDQTFEPAPPLALKQTPLTEKHPDKILTPPPNVDREVLVTARLVTVVVPKDESPADNAPVTVSDSALIEVPKIDPPVIVGFEILVPERLSIL